MPSLNIWSSNVYGSIQKFRFYKWCYKLKHMVVCVRRSAESEPSFQSNKVKIVYVKHSYFKRNF